MSTDFVCFVRKGKPTINEPCDQLVSMNTREILTKMQNESQYLYIHTPFYTKPLQMDSYPIQEFKELILPTKQIKYDRPKYYLSFESTANFIEICVTPKIKHNFEIPPYYVRFELDEIPKMTAADVRNTIQQQLGFDVNSSKIYFYNENDVQIKSNEENINRTESIDSIDILIEKEQIPDENSAQSIIDAAQSKMLYVFFDLSEGAISKIKKRINILAEIISTEKTYINDLRIINESWQPGLQKFLSPDDLQLVFKDIAVIKTCHQSFLSDLEAEGSRYGSRVATPFLEFSNFFKVSQQYIANYPEISEILKKYEKNKKMKQKMVEIADSLDGRDLYSYLITPVQRMPRYLLFLRDLLKVTTQSHPDSELLPIAYESIDEVTKKIDKSTETSKNQQSLMKLQKMITNYTFLDKQRNLVLNTKITIVDGNSSKPGEILVFDDLLVIIKNGKVSKAIFDSPIQRFPFRSQRLDNLSITVDSTNKKYLTSGRRSKPKDNELLFQIKFNNTQEMSKFFEEIEKLQEMEILKFEKLSNRYIFKWNVTPLQRRPPSISTPFISGFEGSLLIISSNEDNQNSSIPNTPDLYRVAISNGTIFKVDVKFPSFKLPLSIASYKKSIFFINDNKLYKYDPKKNKLTNIQASFTPRVGHSSAFCGDNLMIFGGRSTLTNKLLNDLIVYNVKRDMLMVVNPNETTPQPRWRHCSFGHKDKLYIFGGETADGTINNDLYSYELETATWTKVQTTGDDLVRRKDGKAAISGYYVILIGGDCSKNKKSDTTENDEEMNIPQIINLKKKNVQTVENFGNVPDSLTSFDAVFSPNIGNSLCIITPNNLYNISTPAILQKSSSSKHFEEKEDSLRRSGHEGLSFFPFSSSSSSKKSHKRSKSPHGFNKKSKMQDRNSMSVEQFKLDKETELDIHEKPLNDQEKLLLLDSEGSRSANISDNENDSEFDESAAKHQRKRSKTHHPSIPRPKSSAQSSLERFIELASGQYDDESSSDARLRPSLSICNAFPESLQNELASESEVSKDDEYLKNNNNNMENSIANKKIEKVMNLSFCYENQDNDEIKNNENQKENKTIQVESQTVPKQIEKVMNISLHDENKNIENIKERSINLNEIVPDKIEKEMIVSFAYENKEIEEEEEFKETKANKTEALSASNKIEKVMNLSLLDENKNDEILQERSIDIKANVPNEIEKEMIVSFSFENKEKIEIEEEEKADNENNAVVIHAVQQTTPEKIDKVLNISHFYESKNNENSDQNDEIENTINSTNNDVIKERNVTDFIYNNETKAEDLKVMGDLVFEIEEDTPKPPIAAIAATAAISVLLTAGAFFVFKRMRK